LDRIRSNWKRHFEVGQRVQCRVLNVNEEKNSLYLTAKPLLVNSILPVLNELKRSFEGETVIGIAVKPFESGAFLVQFYNQIAGFLPAGEAKTLPDLK
jgi:ribosomal protein S1